MRPLTIGLLAPFLLIACKPDEKAPPERSKVEEASLLCQRACDKRKECHPLSHAKACTQRCRAGMTSACSAEQGAVMICQQPLACADYRGGCEAEQTAWAACARKKILADTERAQLETHEANLAEKRREVQEKTQKDYTNKAALEAELRARVAWARDARTGATQLRGPPGPSVGAMRRVAARALRTVDAENTERLEEILGHVEWFGTDNYSEVAAKDAWTLVLHADNHPKFQARVLPVLEKYAKEGKANPKETAFLFDRVAISAGKPQRYGTQGFCEKPNKWQWRPVENPIEIDKIRKEMGLGPLMKYAAQASRTCAQ